MSYVDLTNWEVLRYLLILGYRLVMSMGILLSL